ncbi:MAG: hypothetical protein R6U27_17540 [Desulfobacterales bacterium]
MKKPKSFARLSIFLTIMFILISSTTLWADDITDAIDEALEYYKQGEFSPAAESLDYAAQLIRQKKGSQLQDILPEPLAGWSAEEASSQGYGAAILGGGINVERRYYQDTSDVTVRIVTDSPMLQGFMVLFQNPMYATADGGRLEKIEGQKAIVKYDSSARNGSINIVVNHRYLITVEGNMVRKKDLTAYAAAVDYKTLMQMQ